MAHSQLAQNEVVEWNGVEERHPAVASGRDEVESIKSASSGKASGHGGTITSRLCKERSGWGAPVNCHIESGPPAASSVGGCHPPSAQAAVVLISLTDYN